MTSGVLVHVIISRTVNAVSSRLIASVAGSTCIGVAAGLTKRVNG